MTIPMIPTVMVTAMATKTILRMMKTRRYQPQMQKMAPTVIRRVEMRKKLTTRKRKVMRPAMPTLFDSSTKKSIGFVGCQKSKLL